MPVDRINESVRERALREDKEAQAKARKARDAISEGSRTTRDIARVNKQLTEVLRFLGITLPGTEKEEEKEKK